MKSHTGAGADLPHADCACKRNTKKMFSFIVDKDKQKTLTGVGAGLNGAGPPRPAPARVLVVGFPRFPRPPIM